MYKSTRVFTILAITLFSFVMLGSTLAAASSTNTTQVASIPEAIAKPAAITAAWDTQFGNPPGGNGVNGEVVALAEDGNGNVYVGGAFNQAGSTTAHNIAMWDGSDWHALIDGNGFNGLSGDVWSLGIDPATGDVYAGGTFARIDGASAGPLACFIARWDPAASTWSALSDGNGYVGTDSYVYSIAAIGGKIYLGGTMEGAGITDGNCFGVTDVSGAGIVSWDTSSSTWSDVGGSMSGVYPTVNEMTTDGANLYAGGFFDTAGGTTAANIAKWNGSSWSALGEGIDGEVRAVELDSGTLYAGGTFTQTGGGVVSANYIAQWDGGNWSALGEGIDGVCMPGLLTVNDIMVQENDLYAAGVFQSAGGTGANNIAKWDGGNWSALGDGLGIHPVFPCEAYDYVNALAWGSVYAGGTFTNAGGTDSHHFGRWITSVPTNGVTVSPQTAVSSAAPNSAVTYTLQIRNTGAQTDSYTITMGSSVFPTQLSINQAHLVPNGTETAVVTVTIPPSAGSGDSDTVVVTATSQFDGSVFDSSQLTTNAYIAPVCQTVLDEPFNASDTPAGWSVVDNQGSNQVWRFDDIGVRSNLTGGSGGFAIVDSDYEGGQQNTELRTPLYDFSSATAVSLTFNTDFYWFDTSKADVDVSNDGGTNWINVWQKQDADYRGSAAEAIDISVAAAGQSNVLVRFHYYDADFDWWWQVDDVTLTSCEPPAGEPDLSFSKDDGGITAVLSSTVVYSLTYSNGGSGAANNVAITETVPANTTFNAAASSTGWSCADNSSPGTICNYAIGSLSAGNGGIITFGVTISDFLPANVTVITNTAVITGAGTATQAMDTTPLLRTPDITLTKTDNLTTVHPGDTLVYTISVQNNGTQDALNVSMIDVLPAGVGFVTADGGGVYNAALHSVFWPPFGMAAYGGGNQVTVEGVVTGPFTQTTTTITNGVAISEAMTGWKTAVDVDNVVSLQLGNLVWDDTDGDGLYEPIGGELGIPEVILNLYQDTNSNNQFDPLTDTLIISESTDANGHYTFTTLIPDDYIVQIAPENFTPIGVLYNRTSSTGNGVPAPDPDDDVNNDDNGDDLNGHGTVAKAVTLGYGSEPTNDGDNDANSNLALDFGFARSGMIVGQKFYDFDGNGSPIFPRDYAIGDYLQGSDIGDLNGDGFMDMAVAAQSGVSLLFGRGDGSFAAPLLYPITDGIVKDVGIDDLNNDGWMDMAVLLNRVTGSEGTSDRVRVFLGRGGGVFVQDQDWDTYGTPDNLLLADLNNDTYPDLIMTHRTGMAMSIRFGKKDGAFPVKDEKLLHVSQFIVDIAIDDLEGDGDLDIVTAHFNQGFIVWNNPGTGLLIPTAYSQPLQASLNVTLGDVDNDNDLDVVLNGGVRVVTAVNNNGTFSSTIVTNVPFNLSIKKIALAHTDGNSNIDLLLALTDTVSIYAGSGNGNFTATPTAVLPVGTRPIKIFLFDLDNDGHDELLTVNQSAESISRYFGAGSSGYHVNRADAGLPNWSIYIDENGDNHLGVTEPLSLTNAGGYYTFTQLTAGSYPVREVLPAGWVQTSPTTSVSITNGAAISYFIGNYELNIITGTIFDDQNQNQTRDGSEPAQVGWTVYLDDDNDGQWDAGESSTTTDAQGRYFFTDLPAKTYFVRIKLNNGWKATTPHPMVLPAISGQTRVIDFGTTPINVVGRKFDDRDGNGAQYAAAQIGYNFKEAIAGDVNGDGNQDVVVMPYSGNLHLSVLLGRGDGTFLPSHDQLYATLPISSMLLSLAVDDLNGDHLDDVVVTVRNGEPPTQTAPSVYILFSKGDGSFQLVKDITLPAAIPYPSGAQLADFNQDNHPDLAILNSNYGSGNYTGTLYIYLNNGLGAFKSVQIAAAGMENDELHVSDMNQDGHPDLLSFGQDGKIWINDGGGQFTANDITFSNPPFHLSIADVDGNNGPDIVYQRTGSFNGQSHINIMLNSGNGTTFGTPTSVSVVGNDVEDLFVGDVDSDGKVDLTAVLRANTMLMVPGNGDGTFQPAKRFDLTARPYMLVPGDLNNDGKIDFLVPRLYHYKADVMLNDGAGQFAPPVEPGLPNWTIYLDNNNNDILDSGDISTTTDINGYYTFTVPLASYRVREVNQQDWIQTSISPTNKIPDGEDITDVDFGNFKLATITGTNYHDLNANLRLDAGESGLSGWTIFLDDNKNGQLDSGEVSTTTNSSGIYTFTKLGPGVYNLRVVTQTGWTSSHPSPQKVSPVSGQTIWTHLGHYQPVNIGDWVWFDSNVNGIQDVGETGVDGITVTLILPTSRSVQNPGKTKLMTTTTNASGLYTFTVKPGMYYMSYTLPVGHFFGPQDQGMFDFNDSDVYEYTAETAVFTTTSGVNQSHWDASVYRFATIGDRVWNDANYNGAQDNAELGIGGVTVTLYISGTTNVWKTTTTNNNGDYSFTTIPGAYWVKFTRPANYIFTHLNIAPADIDNDADAGGRTDTFILYENNNYPDLDAGLVERATVGNRIWRDVNGDGIQDGEEPGMYGITVTLRNGSGIIDTIITNGDGYYTFTQVTPGSYYIHVAKPTGWEYSPKQNPGAPDNDHDSDVDETSGETAYFTLNPGQVDITQDAGMYPLPATIGDRVWHDTDGDGIQDAGEAGMAGATVGLYFVGNTFPIATQTTDANGHYTFTNVLPSDYFLSFTPPGGYYLTARDQGGDDALDSDADSTPSSPTYAQTISFTVSAGDVITTWDAGVYQLGSIGDRVWLDTNRDGIQESSETIGMAGVTVTLHSGIFVITTTQTNNSGHYTFTNLFPNQYHLSFTPPSGYALSPQNQSANDALDSDPNPTSGQTDSFNIASGETVTYWDAGMYRTGIVEQNIYEHVWVVFDLVQSDGITETIYLAGNSHENIFFEGNTEGDAFDDDGNGRDDTLSLLATLAVTGSSSLGTVNMQLNPTFLSQGQLEEHINNTPGTMDLLPYALVGTADSFFDVFFTVEISGTTFTHTVPHRWNGVVRYSPSSSGWLTGISDATIVEINMPVNPTTYTVQNLRYVYGNYDEIRGVSYDDSNGNGVLDVGETALSGWGISLDNPPLIDTTLLDGSYRFGIPLPGTYTVTQTPQASWVSTTPPSVPIMITAPTTPTINFGLLRYASTIPLFPSSGGNLSFVNGQGDTTMLTFSNGAVNAATTLYLGNLDGSAAVRSAQLTALDLEPPDGYANIAHAFRLDAEQGGWLPPSSLQFDVPAALTIEYSDADMEDIDEDSLHLFAWNWASETWVDATENCTMTAQLDTNANQFTADLCQTGRYALFGQPLTGFEIYLPIITRP